MHTGMGLELTVYSVQYKKLTETRGRSGLYVKFYESSREVGDSEDENMKQERRLVGPITARIGSHCGRWKSGRGIAILVFFTMSSRFAARDYDDRPLSSSRSLLDLSPSSRSALGHPTTTIPTDAQDDYDGERSTIRINTDLTTVR